MNLEIFASVLAALIAYRVVAPFIDRVHPLSGAAGATGSAAHSTNGASGSASRAG